MIVHLGDIFVTDIDFDQNIANPRIIRHDRGWEMVRKEEEGKS